VKLEEEAKKLVPLRFYKWIHVFGEKVSERMLKKKDIESYNRYKERVYDKKEKGISVVKRRLRRDVQVYK